MMFRHIRRARAGALAIMAMSAMLPTSARAQMPHAGHADSSVARPCGVPAAHGCMAPASGDSADRPMATMGKSMTVSPLGIPMQRMGSGTSWLPDATVMHAAHSMLGAWDVMLHGVAFVQYDDQGSTRGDRQLGSVNWGMAMAGRDVADGRLTLRTMFSAEPFTVGARGYPLLLQSGEAYRGEPLHDRQHPHDLFMEIAASYERAVGKDVGISVYAAPVGEPASGPVAFPHRPSAMNNPFAPLGHHWQDATHIAFGVLTVGAYTRTVRAEASLFNGREPDENRTNFDYKGRRLDSYAGRVTVNPTDRWSVSGSYAFLASPEILEPQQSLHRVSASVLYDRPVGVGGAWSSAIVYGGNRHSGDTRMSNSALAESNLQLDRVNTVFGRVEIVEKSAEDLDVVSPSVLTGPGQAQPFDFTAATHFSVGELTLGYVRELATIRGGSLGLGAAGTINAVPEALRATYGSRTPLGASVFLRLRPGVMRMNAHGASHGMSGMHGM